jgi:hypothetical protein
MIDAPPASGSRFASAARSPRPRASRAPFIISLILIACLLFVSTEVLLYYRWATMIEPTCVLILETGPQLKGAQVELDGALLPQAHKVIVGEGNRYALAFYVEPGQYTFTITQNERLLLEQQVEFIGNQRGKKYDLTKLRGAPTTQPTSAPNS